MVVVEVVVIDSIVLKNRVLEEQEIVQQEGQYVAIATDEVSLNLSLLCLARSQLKSSAFQPLPEHKSYLETFLFKSMGF